jgi:hypothetical protein
VRELFRRLATLAALRVVNAALDVADAALRTAPGAVRGAPPAIEARVVVTDEPLEAECRIRMATVAGMPEPRGFDTGKAKAKKRAELDETLDLYNLAVEALREDEPDER